MAAVLNRVTKQYLGSVNTPDYPINNWIYNPDMSVVAGYENKYWLIIGDVVSLMGQSQRDAVDSTLAAQSATDDKIKEKQLLGERRLYRALVKAISDAGTRTPVQVHTFIENEIDGDN